MCPPGVCQRGRVPLELFAFVAIISHSRRGCYCTRFGRWKRKREMIRRGDWYEGQCDWTCLRNYHVWVTKTHHHEIEEGNSDNAKSPIPLHAPGEVEGADNGLPAYDSTSQQENYDEKLPGYELPQKT